MRRQIGYDHRSGAHQTARAYAAILPDYRPAPYIGAGADAHAAGNLYSGGQDDLIAHHGIVANDGLLQHYDLIAHYCATAQIAMR